MTYGKTFQERFFDEAIAPKFDDMTRDAVKSIAETLYKHFCEPDVEAIRATWEEWLAEFKTDFEPEDHGALSLPYDMDYAKQLMRHMEQFLLCAMECDI